eukprot:TRINITY_DN2988_c0_g1_i1.p1 TRINITY_DN2988_c0_g1~~TRINITY_DN2988_c0_g1_i1.p1  ORF type:complete len:196 (+),score=11.55 TRINITY_DN2988_c0_g1_i1:266-853(+)
MYFSLTRTTKKGNMVALVLYGHRVYQAIGPLHFTILYIIAGAAAAFGHLIQNGVQHRWIKSTPPSKLNKIREDLSDEEWNDFMTRYRNTVDMPSLGASGSVMGIAMASALLFPKDIVFAGRLLLPIPFAVAIYVVSDTYGIIRTSEYDTTDHAGHVGGFIAGAAYISFLWYRVSPAFKLRGAIPLVKWVMRRRIY